MYVPGLGACEDIVIHHKSGSAFLACGDAKSRMTQWFPPLGIQNEVPPVKDQPFVYDINVSYHLPAYTRSSLSARIRVK